MKVLFLCTGNSARSQMAEGFLREYAAGQVEAESAGLEPRGIHPLTIRVMRERRIDIGGQRSKGLDEVILSEGDTVITLCGDAAEHCPVIPPGVHSLHWALEDPARASGPDAVEVFRRVRDQIEGQIREFVKAGGIHAAR